MLSALSEENAEFLLVGAYALAAHGYPRATGDLDIWIHPTAENAAKVWRALARFGAPLSTLSPSDFEQPDLVLQIGVAPRRIDILTSVTGVEFAPAWRGRTEVEISGLRVGVIGKPDLIRNKRATGRPKDLADAAWLEGPGVTGA
jgi:hypothetical protein